MLNVVCETTRSRLLLILGMHAQEGYGTCLVCVYVSVCLPVTTLVPISLVFYAQDKVYTCTCTCMYNVHTLYNVGVSLLGFS